MKIKPTKKAYRIDFSKIDEGYLYSEQTVHAENINKAKQELLSDNRYENLKLKTSDEEVTYLTIPVIRAKYSDLYEFEGREETAGRIEEILLERARKANLDKLLTENPNSFAYICKRGSYYKPNSCGYTDYRAKAGVYSLEEAVQSAKGCEDISVEIINVVEHNKRLQEEIEDLKNRLIE